MKAEELSKILSALGDREVFINGFISYNVGRKMLEANGEINIEKDKVIIIATNCDMY